MCIAFGHSRAVWAVQGMMMTGRAIDGIGMPEEFRV